MHNTVQGATAEGLKSHMRILSGGVQTPALVWLYLKVLHEFTFPQWEMFTHDSHVY